MFPLLKYTAEQVDEYFSKVTPEMVKASLAKERHDWFGEESHPDYKGVTKEQYANRMLLREIMLSHGFKPLAEEWWHFTLANEPYPDTYFDFPVRE